jgi:hypothetical protein
MESRVSNGETRAVVQSVWSKTQFKIGQAESGATAVALELAKTWES